MAVMEQIWLYIAGGIILLALLGWLAVVLARRITIFSLRRKRALERVLFRILVPKEIRKEEEKGKRIKELLAVADQMYASLYSIYQPGRFFAGQEHLTFEIVAEGGSISFYLAVPEAMRDLVEKQLYAFYPDAYIEEVTEHNIFKEDFQVAGASLLLEKDNIYPIKTYKELESDPLNALSNALSKLGEQAGGAIQLLIKPRSAGWQKRARRAVAEWQAGVAGFVVAPWYVRFFSAVARFLGDFLRAIFTAQEAKTQTEAVAKLTPVQEEVIKAVSEKSIQPGFDAQIRVVTTGKTQLDAQYNLNSVLSAFAQYAAPHTNSFRVVVQPLTKLIRDFNFRYFLPGRAMILTPSELATVMHFPNVYVETPNIKWLLAKRAPAPENLPTEGTFLGENVFRGERRRVYILRDDRRRHMYIIGQTGTGKSTLMRQMILSDIFAGEGVCVIDPHGELIEQILEKIPRERAEDVILFDPGETKRPYGFNMLEYKTEEQKDFLVQEVVNIFYKLFGTEIIGPKFEHWVRNGVLTLMAQPEGGTLIEIPRLFSDDEFAAQKVANVKDPVVKAFWTKEMAATSEFHKSEMLGYFISKFGRFLTNDMMRNIIGQAKSSFDVRQVMDEGKILLCNLSKGKMGEVNSALMGMILISKIQMAAMSRIDIPEAERRDFYLYVDEFQNFATDSFATILSEARKYRLNMTVAHQFIAQLEEKTREAVFGNVGTIVSFRISPQDAELIQKQLEPVFTAYDLVNIENLNAYVKLLIRGVAARPFSMRVLFDTYAVNKELGENIRQLSHLKYGRDKELVAREVYERTKIE
jgi:hypothetical protein